MHLHVTHLTRGEVDRMAGNGAVAGLCLTTEANLGDGLASDDVIHSHAWAHLVLNVVPQFLKVTLQSPPYGK